MLVFEKLKKLYKHLKVGYSVRHWGIAYYYLTREDYKAALRRIEKLAKSKYCLPENRILQLKLYIMLDTPELCYDHFLDVCEHLDRHQFYTKDNKNYLSSYLCHIHDYLISIEACPREIIDFNVDHLKTEDYDLDQVTETYQELFPPI